MIQRLFFYINFKIKKATNLTLDDSPDKTAKKRVSINRAITKVILFYISK